MTGSEILSRRRGTTLITGGAGFIGANLADRLLNAGQRVRILDNLSRPGVERNLSWLRNRHGSQLEFDCGDIRDPSAIHVALAGVAHVFHFAAQVAATTSLDQPIHDFEVNARGTLNVLEAMREQEIPPTLISTSTHKVYGDLHELAPELRDGRYLPTRDETGYGVSETQPMDCRSPHGCSKGAADVYVRDYARTFGLEAVVFRLSCGYGPRQFGTEDQGWLAHFILRALAGRAITLFGDGRQVRDILYIDDLINALLAAEDAIADLRGQAFNLGGGPECAVSLLEVLDLIRELSGFAPAIEHAPWRAADQRYYVSDLRRFHGVTGWSPQVGVREGVTRLYCWLEEISRTFPEHAPMATVQHREPAEQPALSGDRWSPSSP